MTGKQFSKLQREFMAAACCYAEFTLPESTNLSPLQYWKRVSNPEARRFYLAQADALIELVRHMPSVKQ